MVTLPLLEVHVPPVEALVKVTVGKPGQIDVGPEMGAGDGTTVTTLVAIQPEDV
jgi:hypothetical protein